MKPCQQPPGKLFWIGIYRTTVIGMGNLPQHVTNTPCPILVAFFATRWGFSGPAKSLAPSRQKPGGTGHSRLVLLWLEDFFSYSFTAGYSAIYSAVIS
jgi:hypothetical protein